MRFIPIGLLVAGMFLSACSTAPAPAEPAAATTREAIEAPETVSEPEPDVVAQQTTPLQRAIALLDAGKEAEARSELEAILEDKPSMKTALFMMRQIETDPIALLGESNEPYTVKAGDTLADLANRFLGDPLLFHALSKYNDLPSAQSLEVGKVLKIPTRDAADNENTKDPDLAEIAASEVALSAADAEKARDLRRRGLQALNAGQTDAAVDLLTTAHKIDPENKNLEDDLERARSIQKAVATK